MRGRDLERPFSGVRSAREVAATLDRCRAYLPLLRPGDYFSHSTAAILWDCPLPADLEAAATIHVSGPGRAHRGRGVTGHQVVDTRLVIARRHGLPVADAASVFSQLAPMLTLDDLVIVGDHLVLDPAVLDPHDLRPYSSIAKLRERVSSSFRGSRLARAAVELVRMGAESARETLLRLLLQRAGFPEPELNSEVVGVRRRWRHRADIVYRRWKVIAEYDGDQHRTDTVPFSTRRTSAASTTSPMTTRSSRRLGVFGSEEGHAGAGRGRRERGEASGS